MLFIFLIIIVTKSKFIRIILVNPILKTNNKIMEVDEMFWYILEDIKRMEDMMDMLWKDFGGHKLSPLQTTGEKCVVPYNDKTREPYADLQETEKEIIVTAEIPGVKKDDIKVNLKDKSIEISAEVKTETGIEEKEIIQEARLYNKFYKILPLPAEVKTEKAHATYKNGVLEVTLRKLKTINKTTIKVK